MKIFVTRKIPSTALEKLSSTGAEISVSEFDRALTAGEFLERAKGADIILSLLTDKIDGEVIDAVGPQLKLISNYAVGFDNIKVPDATSRGVVVTNTPCEEVNEAVAEHTWALMLALTRRIVESDEAVRRGAYKGWEPDIFLGTNLIGKTLGIVGLGNIGSMVARRARGYNMTVLYTKRSPEPEAEKELGVKFVSLEELLSQSDIVSMHVPLTEQTRGMMNKDTFSKMKKGSYFINTARGPVAREGDLVEVLRSGHLAGAALDVYENEPTVHPELIGMSNVVTTPHTASATYEAREAMGQMAISAILDVLSQKQPQNIVNPEVWENRRK